ncbi:MAG: exo-alpha-sialidase [Cytophagales bacterium]|nr:exo-alpha-sialidase [Cytophagales bacterium]
MIRSNIKTSTVLALLIIPLFDYSFAQFIQRSNTDPRCINNGVELPSETYADQPYVIVCDDGSWLCTMTTSSGTEGAHMNHIISTKSYDQGNTWTGPVDVEPPGPPQSSWAVPLKVPSGRIYVFYNYNQFDFKGIEGVMSGPFVFKYSDDHGKTWSRDRFIVPIRKTKIDEENYTQGKNQFFWSIDKPVVTDEAAYITISKILRTAPDLKDFYTRSEGFILKSKTILKERKPEKIKWETLPDGETGIWNADFEKVQAEHNITMLKNGDLYVVYRTHIGITAYAISRDGGKSFSKPEIMRYSNGEPIGNPRACPKIHKTKDGKYLFWFHNNFRKYTYKGRNPVWISGGIEKNGDIAWSQPEIVLYGEDPEMLGMSYPDYIEQDGKMWLIETEKNAARVHKVDLDLLNGMWNQNIDNRVIQDGLVMDVDKLMLNADRIGFPSLPDLTEGGGFSIELWLTLNTHIPDQEILSTFGPKNKGIQISTASNKAIKIRINDGEVREEKFNRGQTFFSDENTIIDNKQHHVVFIFDGAAKIVSIVVNGILSDGGVDKRSYGWGRIYPYLKDVNDTHKCYFNPSFEGEIQHIRLYNRYLRTSEAISNYNAGIN